MAQSNEITQAMQAYLGQHARDLLALAYNSMDVINDVTFFPDVKNKLILSTLEIDSIVKPFSATFSAPADKFRFLPRELDIRVGKAGLTVNPESYRQTYLAQFQGKGIGRTPEDMPFPEYVMNAVFEKFGSELNDDVAYLGAYNAAGTTAVDVADGFGTILADEITATNVTPNTIGAINNTNAVAQLRILAKLIPNAMLKERWMWKMYMSRKTFHAYEEKLETMNSSTGTLGATIGPKWLRGFENLVELKPVSWMGNSDRVILTPKGNMICAGDAIEGSLAQMNIVQQMWGFDLGVAAAIGFQFRYLPLIICNEAE